VIQTFGLTKEYGGRAVVDGLNLNVERGETYGFLGPNGAGKTTTLKMILGLIKPSSGKLELFDGGHPSDPAVRCRLGVVPEVHPRGMWARMTATEYLRFFGELYSIHPAPQRTEEMLEKVGLVDARHQPFSTFSRGMVQRLSIARALLHDPELLVLDEPISGLDATGIRQVRDLLLEEQKRGRTIFVSSHQLTEMDKICGRVGIMHAGKLRAQDKMSALMATISADRTLAVELDRCSPELMCDLGKLPYVQGVATDGDLLLIRVDREDDYRVDLFRYLVKQGFAPLRIEVQSESLEDAYIAITEESLLNAGFLDADE
jgi:ABC-2 type transport system ATP-binding protein